MAHLVPFFTTHFLAVKHTLKTSDLGGIFLEDVSGLQHVL